MDEHDTSNRDFSTIVGLIIAIVGTIVLAYVVAQLSGGGCP